MIASAIRSYADQTMIRLVALLTVSCLTAVPARAQEAAAVRLSESQYATLSQIYPSLKAGQPLQKSALATAIKRSPAANIVVDDLSQVPIVRGLAPSRLVLLKRSGDPAAALKALERRPTSVQVIHSIPRNAVQAGALHGPNVTSATVSFDALRTQASGLTKLSRTTVVDYAAVKPMQSVAASVEARLAAQPAEQLTMLIGHVERDAIKFVDGSSLALTRLQALKAPGTTWVFGCNTLERGLARPGMVATTRAISYSEALLAVETVAREAAITRGTLRSLLVKMQKNLKLGFAVTLAGAVVVISLDQALRPAPAKREN
jgi:hypothetical protein